MTAQPPVWVVQFREYPLQVEYLSGKIGWTVDATAAIRFARQADAEQFISHVLPASAFMKTGTFAKEITFYREG